MPAPKGNRFWEARAKHGRKKKYLNPDDLWKQCCEYFEWVEANPLWEIKVAQYQGSPVEMPVDKMRAMTIGGLLMFIDCARSTWDEYKKQEGFSEVIARAEEVIYLQKFSGAAADLLNANIIARDLGLADKKDVDANLNVNSVEWTVVRPKPRPESS